MMIVMKPTATEAEIEAVIDRIESVGRARLTRSTATELTVIGAVGDREHVARLDLDGAPGVDRVVPILKPYKLASSEIRQGERTVLDIGGSKIGGGHFALIAGPCTVESREQTLDTADVVKAAGATFLRGGAYKPRTSPYGFKGLGQEGLRLLAEAKERDRAADRHRVLDVRDLEAVLEVADVIQIGARNMQNYALLTEIGRCGRPVLIKRGLSSTLEELLMAAEYVLKEGNPTVILCERGHPHVRDRLPLHARPVARSRCSRSSATCRSSSTPATPRAGGPGRAAEPRGRGGGRRRDHRRGPSRARARALRRPAAAAGRRVRRVRGARRPGGGAGRQRDSGERGRVKVCVVGVGLIGGSIALAAREQLGAHVSGFEPDRRGGAAGARRAARSTTRPSRWPTRSTGPRSRSSPRRWACCTRRFVETLAGGRPGCAVTDVGSTKRAILVDDQRFIGGHPLAGGEAAGVEHARGDLFAGATWYLTPTTHDLGRPVRAPAPRADRRSARVRPRSTPRSTTA